ncbi:MAG TPA: 16S rRNA (adenine(1518)-N(6)/adenine(1519)-N(6))-dimethyltransferase RsmA [Kiritimatiellia bacterium]|mgnify:CR=1 FL=1|nr:16S rRNA (adenine(1518)-N(6)/adenine(1519)-N(6))-dimethyltransferase RsmA [Kiritimatiellia bacterium]
MNLTRPTEVRALLERLDFKPSRVLGQNFLIDGNTLRIMLDAAELSEHDAVLEIGPGLGVLTGPLLERAGRVVAIEKDDMLHAHLVRTLGGTANFTLLHADALDVDLHGWLAGGLNKVVANLPYSVGTRILVELCHAPARPERMVVTVQREVADRMIAKPGGGDYGVLSVFAQVDYAATLHKVVSRNCFFPVPQVESAIVLLVRRERSAPIHDEPAFRALVKRCFEHRRKQLGTLVKNRDAIANAGLDPQQRPETLSVDAWVRLANALGT